jgi:hypothetical protein
VKLHEVINKVSALNCFVAQGGPILRSLILGVLSSQERFNLASQRAVRPLPQQDTPVAHVPQCDAASVASSTLATDHQVPQLVFTENLPWRTRRCLTSTRPFRLLTSQRCFLITAATGASL